MHRRRPTTHPARLLALLAVSALASHGGLSTTTATGLTIEYTDNVTCSRPTHDGDTIAVHYRGTLQTTGAVFDESYQRGAFKFTLGQHRVIAGWDQGLVDMCPGERRKLIIPPDLGYGDADMGVIPSGSTLVFETELVDIVGVDEEEIHFETYASPEATPTATVDGGDGAFSIATAPSTPPPPAEDIEDGAETVDADHEDEGHPSPSKHAKGQAECHLLGPFALLVQGALGVLALLTLVWKRYRETPKRPWRIWLFDVSKQVVGSALLHVLNLAMSMLGSGDMDMVNVAASAGAASAKNNPDERTPNPCSFYLLNLGIDVSIHVMAGRLRNLLIIFHADHHWRACPLHLPQNLARSLPLHSPGKPPGIHQVRELLESAKNHVVSQTTPHILYWLVLHEDVRAFLVRGIALAALGRRLGVELDAGK